MHLMVERKFQPGFRLSVIDVLVLVLGGVGSGYANTFDRWFGIAVAFVVLHFFLFCNVLRLPRLPELIWAGVFSAMACGAIALRFPPWSVVFGVSLMVTVAVAFIEIRRPSYHGVGWQTLNPGLPEWWRSAAVERKG